MLEAKGCGDNFMPGEERDPQMLKGMCEDPAMGGVEGCAYRPNPDGVGRVCVEVHSSPRTLVRACCTRALRSRPVPVQG